MTSLTKTHILGSALCSAAFLGVSACTWLTGPAAAEPARWEIRDADSTITLFGSVHVLRPDISWRTPAFDAALKDAQEVWFEVPIGAGNPSDMQKLVAQYGLSPGKKLSQSLSAQDNAKLAGILKDANIPPAAFEPFRPWFAALNLSIINLNKGGYNPESGVEQVLGKASADKPQKSFETVEQQIRFFADLAPETELEFLRQTLEEYEDGPKQLEKTVAAWQMGDLQALERDALADMRRDYPALYVKLVKERNAAWVKVIAQEMAGSGTDFIAVGALHLVGVDGVPQLLRAAGFNVVQVSGKIENATK